MALYVEEFLYRGRPEGSSQPVAYHVVIGEVLTSETGSNQIVLHGPMTPERAERLGFPLSVITEQINAGVLKAYDEVVAEKARIEVELEQAVVERVRVEKERDDALARRRE